MSSVNRACRLTFGDLIREHRHSYPDAVALVDGEVRLTWPELDERTNRLADALTGAGVGPGDRILWLGQNSFRIWELLGAAAKIGAMVCPGYWRWAAPEMAYAIEDFDPRVIVWQDEEIGDTVAKARAELGGEHRALWLRHDVESAAGADSYESFLASGSPEDPETDVDPDSALLVIYTAAITGRQSGSMLSHRNLLAMGASAAWMGDIGQETAFLGAGPMFHIGNYQFWGIPAFVHGGKNVVVRRVIAEELLPVLAAERCTHAYLMPPTIAQLVALNREAGHDLSQLRASVAAPVWEGMVPTDTSRFTRNGGGEGRGYGQTEVTGFAVTGAYGGTGTGNAGRPGPFTSVRILDSGGRECETGEAGEICVRGDLVHLGYWNRPEINEERFRFGWWHTTDLGRREADGTISFLGTTTRMLKSAAENIFPAEVENCIESHPAVKEAAVIGVPNERWAQDVKAVVVLRDGAEATAEEIVEHCRARIASYKKPKTVEFIDALPRTGGYAKDYEALDARFGGGGYPGGDTLGAGR
ncbi:AMP-binding protein [Streptomyces yerevanensis]|uniref:AMP-binding protein n=1 Tax=Streptomyces yerevanensis TaxID=66378 RepID=UPI0005252E24|nr:AMP-binding protein [Streptomyces yerevanensis]